MQVAYIFFKILNKHCGIVLITKERRERQERESAVDSRVMNIIRSAKYFKINEDSCQIS